MNRFPKAPGRLPGSRRFSKICWKRCARDPRGFSGLGRPPDQPRRSRGVADTPEKDRERARLLIRFYQLLYKKYNPQHLEII